jgi:hypothetical protein
MQFAFPSHPFNFLLFDFITTAILVYTKNTNYEAHLYNSSAILKMSEDKALRRIFGNKRHKVNG